MKYDRLSFFALPYIWALVHVEVGTAPDVWEVRSEEVGRVAGALTRMPVGEE